MRDPALELDGRVLASWQQLAAGAGFQGIDPPAGFGFQSGLAPALPDNSYVVAPQYFFGGAGQDDALWINNAINQGSQVGGATGGVLVRLMNLPYFTLTPIRMGVAQYLVGCGPPANGTIISQHFTGDAVRTTFTGSYSGQTTLGGGITGVTIDGTSAGAGSSGLHAGDISHLRYDMMIRNYPAASSVGYHFDNTTFFTERLAGSLIYSNCGTGVLFDVNGGTGSFERPDLVVWCDSSANQTGVSITGTTTAAFITSGNLAMFGNFNGGTGNAALNLAGSGSLAQLTNVRLDIGVENNSVTNAPTTIKFAGGTNGIVNCYGTMNFLTPAGDAAWVTASLAGGNFRYQGTIAGDTGLQTMLVLGTKTLADPGNNGTYDTTNANTARTVPAAARTGMILSAGTPGQAGKPFALMNESAFSITFAASGTSNVADGVADVIAANTAATFYWDATAALWFRG